MKTNINRRQFLKSTTATGLGLIILPSGTLSGANAASRPATYATAATGSFSSAGAAGVVSISVSNAWMKIYGGCPATPSPGNARIAEIRMDLGINK